MDEQNSKKDTPKKDKSTRPLSDPTDGIQQAKEDSRARHRHGSQSEHYVWGLSWPQFLGVVVGACTIVAPIIAALMQRAETLSTQEKERARVVLSAMQRDPDLPLSFSLIFKNVGETTALNAYGAWLLGECQYNTSQECVAWCVEPLRETRGKGYGPLISQGEHIEKFSSTLKTGKARKKQRPIYYCGYFAYTDVFCMWRREFYCLSYNPTTDQVSPHILMNAKEEEEIENCSPWRLY